jgi:hypothetical protein
MRTIEKALEVRKNLGLKSREPSKAFVNRLKHARVLVELTEKSASKGLILEARRLYIVTLAAAFESFWRDLIKSIVNKKGLTLEKDPHLSRLTFSLADVQQIIGHRVTIGELIAVAYTFQSPETVNQAVSEIFKIDAFSEFKRKEFLVHEISRKNRAKKHGPARKTVITGESALRKIPQIKRCFEIRHNTVHDIGSRYRISQTELLEIENAVWYFNSLFGMFVEDL